MRSLASWSTLLVVGLVACGGKVVVDSGDGAGGEGGGATTSSSSSSGPTSSSVSASSSVGSSSSSSSSTGGGGGCPDPFPGIQAPCDQEGAVCAVPGACCSGNAVCKGGLWTSEGTLCNMACIDCGPNNFACVLGNVCVVELSFSTVYKCAPDPCVGGPLKCSCAKDVCAADGYTCNNTSSTQIFCDCPNC
jgi:hypothetical protein